MTEPAPNAAGRPTARGHRSALARHGWMSAPTTLLVLATLATACAQDYHEATWPDLVTARQQDAIDREWIPAFLPEAATDLRQRNQPSTGARIAVAHLPADVDVPECGGPSDDPVPLDAPWFPIDPAEPGEALACDDGWTISRSGDDISMWNIGTLEEFG